MPTFAGCAALTSAKSGADSAKGAADDAKVQKDSATAAVKDEKDKAKGGGGGGGGDAAGPTRLEATDGQINMPISDKIDVKKGKANDWRKFTLVGKPGQFATFELHWDEETANLSIDVYDKFGVNVGKSPRRIEGQSSKRVLLRIDDPGPLLRARVGADKADNSIYTMMVRYHGPVIAPAVAAAPAPAPAPVVATTAAAAAPAPAPCPPGQNCPAPPDPNKVYGTIVSMVREGSAADAVPRQGLGRPAARRDDGHDPRRPRRRQAVRGRQLLHLSGDRRIEVDRQVDDAAEADRQEQADRRKPEVR